MTADLAHQVRAKLCAASDALSRATDSQDEHYVLKQLDYAKVRVAEAEKMVRESAGVRMNQNH